MENSPVLETERLILRPFVERDAKALFAIYSDEVVNTYLPWFPLKTLEEAKTFLTERYLQTYDKPSGYRYAICRRENNVPIGYVHVSMDDSHDLGYGLCKEFWNMGITTEAGRAVIEQLRQDGVPYVTATHDVNNLPSGCVMRKLGMSYRYSYEERWMPKDIPVTFRMYQLNLDGQHERVYQKYWDQSTVRFREVSF